MLQLISLAITFIAVFVIATTPYGKFVRFLETRNTDDAAVSEIEKILGVIVAVIAFFVCYFGPWQYSFPPVFDGDYVATYENGRVVKHPKGTWSYSHEGEVFRALSDSEIEYGKLLGQVTISYKPYIILENLEIAIQVMDMDEFYRDPEVRRYGIYAHHDRIHAALARAQEDVFQDYGAVTDKTNCGESRYFEEVAERANKEFTGLGFRITKVDDSMPRWPEACGH